VDSTVEGTTTIVVDTTVAGPTIETDTGIAMTDGPISSQELTSRLWNKEKDPTSTTTFKMNYSASSRYFIPVISVRINSVDALGSCQWDNVPITQLLVPHGDSIKSA